MLGVGRRSQAPAHWVGEYVQADLSWFDIAPLLTEFAPDIVLHGAGTASVRTSMEHPLDDFRGTLLTWANTLDGVRRSGCRPVVVFPSSAAVYGNAGSLPIGEDAPAAPVSAYGYHKWMAEILAREYAACYGVRVLTCRLFSVFGPTQNRLLVWEIYNQLRRQTNPVVLQGTGAETRDYLSVGDVAGAVFDLSAHFADDAEDGSMCVVNVASGCEISTLTLAKNMARLMGRAADVECRGHVRSTDPLRWRGDNRRLVSLAPNWEATSLDRALGECIRVWEAGDADS